MTAIRQKHSTDLRERGGGGAGGRSEGLMKRRRIEKCHLPCAHIVDLHRRVAKYQVRGFERRDGGEGDDEVRTHIDAEPCRRGYRIFLNSRRIRREERQEHHRHHHHHQQGHDG